MVQVIKYFIGKCVKYNKIPVYVYLAHELVFIV